MSRDHIAKKIVVSACISRFSPSVWQRAFLKLAQSSPLGISTTFVYGSPCESRVGALSVGGVSDWLLLIGQRLMQSDRVCLEASIGKLLTNRSGLSNERPCFIIV